MRIISGTLRGKKIFFEKILTTRPLRDFVKENIFNLIEHSKLIRVKIKDSNILDLYSGPGSFGLECVSRGAKKVYFFEKNIKVFNLLKRNIRELKVEKNTNPLNSDIGEIENLNIREKFDIAFFDPPYKQKNFNDVIRLIKNNFLFNKEHIILIHRERSTDEDLEKFLNIFLVKQYGRSKIIFAKFN